MKTVHKLLISFIIAMIICGMEVEGRQDRIRWCKNRVRDCSRKRFSSLITQKIEAMNASSLNATTGNATGGVNATDPKDASLTPPDPATARKKRDTVPASPRRATLDEEPLPEMKNNDNLLDESYGSSSIYRRVKRDDVNATATADNSATTGADNNGTAAGQNATVVVPRITTTETPSYPLPPPQIFNTTELEDTFYSCLDDLGVKKCKGFMFQRCNWHDGRSPVIANYCHKWNVPCLPCANSGNGRGVEAGGGGGGKRHG